MLEAKFNWKKSTSADETQVATLAKDAEITPFLARLLISRQLTTVEQVQAWLTPTIEQLHDPNTMFDMAKGVARIQAAVSNGEQITVYGDYDADGLTSTALMYETLAQLGAEVNYYIPNRFTDGYGPNVEAFNRLIDAGTQLFVTVDNGVAGQVAIDAAKQRQVDVVVTDHHELPAELPDAYAIIHPRHPQGHYPFGGLSGVGVAFKVAQSLLEASADELSDALDLVAIGEIADLVPLTDENHALVKFGLQVISQTQRPGLIALMKAAGIDATAINEEHVGFGIAPRLNALGRLGDANPAVELLTTLDEDRATELAQQVNQQNEARQELVKTISADALTQAQNAENQARPALVIHGQGWHEGVLGIVASKIVEATHKPTLVLSDNPDQGTLKGSGRSIEGFDLFAALNPIRDHLVAFGGHAMACGLTVAQAQLDLLTQTLIDAGESQAIDVTQKATLPVTTTIAVNEVTESTYQEVQQLGPFGMDNPQPIFEIRPTRVDNIKTMGTAKNHLKFMLFDDQQVSVPAIAFGLGHAIDQVTANPEDVAVVGTLSANTWQGRTTYQLMVKDLQVEGVAIVLTRTNNLTKPLFARPATYLFFQGKLADQLQPYLSDGAQVLRVGVNELPASIKDLVIVDCPPSLTVLQQVLAATRVDELTTYFYERDSAFLSGMPSRAEYSKLFNFIKTHQNVDVGQQMAVLADFLKIDLNKLIFMIQLFFEAGFVKIEAGVMNGVSDPKPAKLSEMAAYHQRLQRIDAEEKLLYSKGPQLKAWLVEAMNQAI